MTMAWVPEQNWTMLLNLSINWRESHETSRDVEFNWRESCETLHNIVCFSSDLTVNIGSIRPKGRAPKTMEIAITQ